MATIRAAIGDVFDWWTSELRALAVPERRMGLTLRATKEGLLDDRGRLADIERLPMDAEVSLTLDADRVLVRPLSKRRLPLSRARALAEFDVLANLPFPRDDIEVLHVAGEERNGTEAVVVRRDIIAPLFEALGRRHLRLAELTCGDNGRRIRSDDIERLLGRNKRRSTSMALLALALLGPIAAFVTLETRLDAAETSLDEEVGLADAAARKARIAVDAHKAEEDRLAALVELRQSVPPVTAILESLTVSLPDSTALTALSLTEGELRLSGTSRSSAALIPLLQAVPGFHAPSFVGPVFRLPLGSISPGGPTERFTLLLKVGR